MPSWRSVSGRETLPKVPEIREWSGNPTGGPGVDGRHSQRSGSGREAIPELWEWSGSPPEGPGGP